MFGNSYTADYRHAVHWEVFDGLILSLHGTVFVDADFSGAFVWSSSGEAEAMCPQHALDLVDRFGCLREFRRRNLARFDNMEKLIELASKCSSMFGIHFAVRLSRIVQRNNG